MSFPGLSKSTPKTCAQGVMAMAGLISAKKPRKQRAKETAPRNREEDKFRNILIKFLRKKYCKVVRVEPSFRGEFGLGDLWVFCEATAWGGWVETKSLTGGLSDDQKEVRRLCVLCGIKYLVVRTLEEAERIYKINIS